MTAHNSAACSLHCIQPDPVTINSMKHAAYCRPQGLPSASHCKGSLRALRSVLTPSTSHNVTIPAFLVPSLAQPELPRQNARFSTTPRNRSKIGRAPLSVPPEVTFRILETPQPKQIRNISRSEPSRKVEIQGPLGMMSLDIRGLLDKLYVYTWRAESDAA